MIRGRLSNLGRPAESILLSAVRYEDFEMPPSGKLSDRQIDLLERWISMGAPWPDEPEPQAGEALAEFDWRA